MTAPQHHETLWGVDAALEGAIARTKEVSDELFERRAQVWALLVSEGVEQKEIAERAGVDPSDVSRALSTRGL